MGDHYYAIQPNQPWAEEKNIATTSLPDIGDERKSVISQIRTVLESTITPMIKDRKRAPDFRIVFNQEFSVRWKGKLGGAGYFTEFHKPMRLEDMEIFFDAVNNNF